MKTLSLKLPARLDAKLTAAAKRQRTTKSAVVREALDKFLNGRKTPAKSRRSALELAGDLIGSLEGPGDLSYNPDYMRGFGE
jgi:hypothetical protein